MVYMGSVPWGELVWFIGRVRFLWLRFFLFFLASMELAAGLLEMATWRGFSFWVLWTRVSSGGVVLSGIGSALGRGVQLRGLP